MEAKRPSPLLIPVLKHMSRAEGLDNRALLAMQAGAVRHALRVVSPSHPEVMKIANESLPTGASIYTLYHETLESMSDNRVDELERIGKHLQWMINDHLPRQYVKAKASESTMSEFAARQGAIAKVLASVMTEADKLANDGVIAVNKSTTLTALTERPEGPLSEIYDKAVAIRNQQSGPSMRLA